MARGGFGLDILVGGNIEALKASLRASEAEVKASAGRQAAIGRELVNREARLVETALEQKIRAIRESASEAGKAIKAEIASEQQKAAMLVRLAQATALEIAAARKDAAAKVAAADQAAARAAVAAQQAAATRQGAIAQDLAAREHRLSDTTLQAKIRAVREAASEAGKVIKSEIADEQAKAAMLTRLARATSAEIVAIKKAELAKLEASVKAEMGRESAAKTKAALAAQGTAVDALGAKYAHLNAVGDAFGMGLGGRLRTLKAQLVELHTTGLAGTEAGMRAVLHTEQELTLATAGLKTQLAGLSLAGAAGLSVGIGAAVQEFANFEKSLNRFKALSDATGEQMARVSAESIKLGSSTKFSAVEAADGLGELAAAGFNVEQALAAIPGVLAAAAADGMAVARAAEIVGATLNGFGFAADQAGRVSDILAQTARVSATSIADMGESLKYASTIAASTSQSIEEVSTDLAIMANAGIKGSQAGTTFRGAMSSLLKPSDEAGKTLEKLGISLTTTKGKMLPLSDVLAQMRDKTAGMTEAQRGLAVATVFGQEAMTGVLSIMKLTDTQMATTAGQVRAYNGASQSTADTMNKGVLPALEEMKGAFSALGIAVGEGFAPAVVAVANGAQAIAAGLASIDPVFRPLITLTASGAVTFLGLAGAVTLLGPAAMAASAGVAVLGTTVRVAFPWFGALALAVGAVTAAMDYNSRAIREAAAVQDAKRQKDSEEIENTRKRSASVLALAAEHDKLAGKARLTKDEQKRLHAIQQELEKQHPAIAAAIKKSGDRHWATSKAVLEEARAVDILIDKRIQLAKMEGAEIRGRVIREQAALNDAVGEADRADAADPMVGGIFSAIGRGVTAAKVEFHTQKLQGLNSEFEAFNKHLGTLARAKRPVPATVRDPRGPGFNEGKDDKPKGNRDDKPKGNRDAGNAANQAFQDAKAAAEAEAAFAEAVAERGYAAARDGLTKRLALLEQQRAAGRMTEADYLLAVEQTKAREVDLEAEAAKLKLYIQRQAVERELAAAAKVGKGKTDEAKAFAGKLAVIDTQLAGAEDKRLAGRATLHQQTNAALAADAKKLADDERATLTDLDGKKAASDKQERDNRTARMTGIDKERQLILDTYEDAKTAANAAADEQIKLVLALQDAGKPELAEETRKQAKATREAAMGAALLKKELDLTDVAKKNTSALQEMAAALVAVSMDPSLERIANFVRDFALNPEKIKQVAEAVTSITTAAQGASGPLGAAVDSVGALLAAVGGPLPIALGAVSLISGVIANEWERAAKYAADMLSIEEELADLQAEGDPEAQRNLALKRNNKARKKKVAEIRTQVRAELQAKALTDASLKPRNGSAFAAAPEVVTDVDVDIAMAARKDLADALELFARYDTKIELRYDDSVIETAAGVAKRIEETRANTAAEAEKLAKLITESNARTVGFAQALADVNKEIAAAREAFASSEQNDRGEAITVQARASLDAEKLRADYAKKVAGFREAELAATKARAKIDADERAAIQNVLDGGIATRAKTESEFKTDEIAKIRAAAGEQRTALDDESKKRMEERIDAKRDFDIALARVENLSSAKITAHNKELSRLDAIRRANEGIIEQEKARLELSRQIGSDFIGPVQTSGKSSTGKPSSGKSSGFSGGELTGKINPATGKKYHSGGIVAGSGEVPSVLKAGEMVLTEGHQSNLWDWLNAVRTPQMVQMPPGYGAGGGTINAPLTVNITAAPGQDGRSLWRTLRPEMDAWLRSMGKGR